MSGHVQKNVNYLGRDFGELRKNLIDFAKNYFPQTYNDFNESSPGMMFIEMAAYVGDVLSYYTDHNLREGMLHQAQETKNIMALASALGYNVKNVVGATVTLDVFQLIPATGTSPSITPDWSYAMTIQDNMAVKAEGSAAEFRTVEPVDFSYSSSLSPTEVTVYSVNETTGAPEWYLLKKQAKAVSGRIFSKDFTFGSPKIYDKITITDENLIEVIDVIDGDNNKWYQVPYLAQDTIFESVNNTAKNDPELSAYRSEVPYLLKLKKTSRRFTANFKDQGRLELQFGAGISEDLDEDLIPNPDLVGTALPGRERDIDLGLDPSNFLYTKTYGLAPANTTLTVRYTLGQGVADNVAPNQLTDIINFTINLDATGLDAQTVKQVKGSVACTNPNPAVGGASKEEDETIRNQALANFASQNRAVTKEDYIVRAYSLPPRFGSIAKAYIVQDDQLSTDEAGVRNANPYAMNMYLLGYDSSGKLTQLNDAVKTNLKEYLSQYRLLTDGINIKNAFIINIGVDFEIVPRPDQNANEVVLRCVAELKKMFNSKKWQINQPIQLSTIRVALDKVDGVQTVKHVAITNKFDKNEGYSGNIYDIEQATKEGVVYPSLDPSIFEVKYLDKDIRGRTTGN
jgi:phage-related baseplate assembly protein